jgi:hypothetical protein
MQWERNVVKAASELGVFIVKSATREARRMLQRYARRGKESRRDEVATKWGAGERVGGVGEERCPALPPFLPILETGKAGWGPAKPRTSPLALFFFTIEQHT